MIIYEAQSKDRFLEDQPNIEILLKKKMSESIHEKPSDNEVFSWKNSLAIMADIVRSDKIPNDVGIFLEYNIPTTDNRVDFIITGKDDGDRNNVVLIELKQWQHVKKTSKDGIVETKYNDGLKETLHPSYQVFSYAYLLYSNIEPVQKKNVMLKLAAFLHNCEDSAVIHDSFYSKYLKHAEAFCIDDRQKLIDFIAANVKKGDRGKGLYEIEHGNIRPSKSLADSLCGMVKGNREFMMIDSQKLTYENVLTMHDRFKTTGMKQVMIVKGGPGTGKSVIGINLLCEATRRGWIAKYVTKNNAPRNVYSAKLQESHVSDINTVPIDSLFKGSLAHCFGVPNQYDLLIVDEAHRLMNGTLYDKNDDQMAKLINAAKTIVFFIDENQRVSLEDAGSIEGIISRAKRYHCAEPTVSELISQFRCNGSTLYLRWLDNLLQITPWSKLKLSDIGYDLKVMDTPNEVMNFIKEKNKYNNKSRVVAGYCWEWKSRKRNNVMDIEYPEYNFAYQWNHPDDKTWSITEGSIDQIGCIHTCQGLEFDYVGVIIPDDLIYRNGKVEVNPSKHPYDDRNLKGWKRIIQERDIEGKEIIRRLIKNTYRTLLTRGMKGCRVFIQDPELKQYFIHNI